MTIWLYCICRDEAKLMPYFLRHYTPWVSKLIFYDDQSEDGTRELIAGCPQAELRDWPGEHGIVDDQFLAFANEQWKEARGKADWIIWVDADELVYHPDILSKLAYYLATGVTLPQILGYTMIADHFPTTTGQIYDEIKTGAHDGFWSKPALFRENIVWTVGRHGIDHLAFNPRLSNDAEIKLLHYRCLGLDYLTERHKRNWGRVPERCRNLNYGVNCSDGHEGHHGAEWFAAMLQRKLPNVI